MAASRFLLRPLLRPAPLGLLCGTTALLASHSALFHRHPSTLLLRADSPRSLSDYESSAKTPVTRGGRPNPRALRQVTIGSISGLFAGLAVSMLSKPLAVVLGLLVVGVQALESRGFNIVPYKRLQSWFKNTNVRSLVLDNVALKLAFGVTFALAGFAEF